MLESILPMLFVIFSVVTGSLRPSTSASTGPFLTCRLDSMGTGHQGGAFNARSVLIVPFSACHCIGYVHIAQIIMF